MFNDKFILLADTVKNLGISCEQLGIQYTSKLSTLEVTVSQQTIQIRKLQKRIDELEYTDTDEVLIEANIDLGDEEMTNDERIQSQNIANAKRLDERDASIDEVIEWELAGMDYEDLAEYYFKTKMEGYINNPDSLKDMLQYKKGIENTEVVLYWDTDKKDVQPVTTRNPSWDVSKAPIEFKNPNLDIEVLGDE